MRPSRRIRSSLPRRAAPCAGLFGWRKESAPPRGKDDDPDKKPGSDKPCG
ncbi:MAG: hypothetical protein JNL35_15250 [Sphingopyxis sp.]|nr:hypothetical protein [Sphingopyxis sp.]